MKTLRIVLLAVISILTANTNAQIKILTNGYVGIATTTPGEALELNGNIRGGSATAGALKVNTASNGYGLFGPQNNTYCHMITDRPSFAFNKIVVTYSGEFGALGASDFIFRTGVSWNTTGITRMTINNSTGYVGINNTSPSYNLDVNGGINTSGSISIAGVVKLSSDERLKNNIKNLSGSLGLLTNLRGVSYKFNAPTPPASIQPLSVSQSDSSKTRINPPVQNVVDTTFYNRTHKGFLAQEVMKVFPELVYADKNGMLSVDYISLIPILVESLKELTTKYLTDSLNCKKENTLLKNRIITDSIYFENKLKALENNINQCCGKPKLKSAQIDNSTTENSSPTDVATLSQNAPNPFNITTTIGYYLPLKISNAIIYIYNMQGVQLKSIPITDRGNGNITINSNELKPGMYLYSLIADGNEVDTKRMILTN